MALGPCAAGRGCDGPVHVAGGGVLVVDVALALCLDGLTYLLRHQIVVGGPLNGADDANRYWELRVVHAREHERNRRVIQRCVMHQDVGLGDAVLADLDHLRLEAVNPDALVAVLAEDHRLALL